MREDYSRAVETARVGAAVADFHPIQWRCTWRVEKRLGDDQSVAPYEVIEQTGNLLMYGGASLLWECLGGNGGSGALQYLNSANAYLAVGDSNTSEAATQTDLQAASNKVRAAATFSHTDGTTSGSATATWAATFGTGVGNFAWAEWGIMNASSAGRMLNRKVASLGTKTSAASWSLTVSLALS